MTHNVLREHGRAPASSSGQTETRVRLCWHRAGLAQPGTHRRVASGQGGHCLCEPPVSLGRAQSPRHPACSRGWSQDSRRTLPRSCHPGTACPLPWRAPLCPGPSLWPCPARTGDTGRALLPGAPSSSCGCGGWTSLCTDTPRDGPSLTVPCHQGPQPGLRGTAGSEDSRGLGRVPGEVKPDTGVGSSPAASRPSPATGQRQCGDSPVPPSPQAGRGDREHTSTGKGRVLPCSCVARAAQEGIPLPGA